RWSMQFAPRLFEILPFFLCPWFISFVAHYAIKGAAPNRDRSNVTLALSTANGAALSGTTTVAAVGGVATFSTLSLDKAGSYTLAASADNLTSATSTTFAITAGAAATAQSAIAASPLTIASDGIDASTITITLRDSNGNTVPNAPVFVNLTGPGDLSQQGQLNTNSDGQLQTMLRSTTRGSGTVTAYIGSNEDADRRIGSVVITYLVDEQKVVDTFQEVTGAFISRRMDQIIANEPRSWTLDRRRMANGVPQVSMKASGEIADPVIDLVMEYGRVSDDQQWYVWSEAVFSRYTDSRGNLGKRKGDFGMLSLGTDYLVTDTLAIGLIGQVDRASDSIVDFSKAKGTGWLVGPYLSMEISPDLFFNARASFGASSNTASVDVFEDGVFFDGKFKTRRALLRASLKGKYELERVTLYPDAELAYLRETQRDYSVTDGVYTVSVPGVRAEIGRFSLGGTVDMPFDTSTSALILFARPQFDWNFNRAGAAAALETWRGSLELGLRSDRANGWDGEISVRYDGIGTSGFNALAARAKFGMRF
ncbi:MAG: autotransporter domain-containing protein, partial [Roseinatronobacter sp.]|nr:autotransporter domain-containing protein [Roseinatronobacter sp.]